ncbi:MAG: pilus assembly protein [Alphaproteobacteria bacterium]|nr:pilus assembly protein [Alphaproteobacteria bacterium]
MGAIVIEIAKGLNVSALCIRFRESRDGVAALEFALIAPMMFLLLFMSFELTDAAAANSRAEIAAGSLADIVSRDVVVTDEEVEDLFAAVPWLTHPTEASRVTARITSVFIDEDGVAEVQWSEGAGMTPLAPGTTIAIPEGMQIPNSGLVVGETLIDYEPPLGLFSAMPFEIAKVEYRRPRIADPVIRE